MIKAILFDLDNTLIDFMKMKHESCKAAIDAMIGAGLKRNKEQALKELYELYDEYGIEYQQIFQKFVKKINGKIDYRIIAYGVLAYRKIRESNLVTYPKVIPALKELKKHYKLAVVSDAPVVPAWMRLVGLKIDRFFDVVITMADTRKQKTHAAPYKATLRELNIRPEEAVMIGDRIPRDIETARKLGIHTIYARYGDTKKAERGKSGADAEINNVSEIIEVVKKMGNFLNP